MKHMSYDAGRQLLATVGQDHVIKVHPSSHPVSHSRLMFLKNATFTDLEHEDSVGGFIDGGSLAEGHREEPGGG